MASLENLTFEGKDGESVTAFLQSVKRVAFSQGRQRDDEWLVDYLETCLSEEALVWYDELDDGIRGNYKILRSAMLQRFGAPAPKAPSPAAAAPMPVSPAAPFLPPQRKRQGRIAILRLDGLYPGYCARERYNDRLNRWECDRTTSSSEALIVEICAPQNPSTRSWSLLKIVSADNTSGDLFLGVAYRGTANNGTIAIWTLAFCDKGLALPYPRATCLNDPGRRAASSVWSISEDSQELSAIWVASYDDGSALEFRVDELNDIWIKSATGKLSPNAARLYFEPI
ncbi:hypothetical protein FRB97_008669 [Tulasnella sp. 331]|nr:hypothetical protein FRB97_008669 [Tulasnella sp. 331]